jgi:hypothetical protein
LQLLEKLHALQIEFLIKFVLLIESKKVSSAHQKGPYIAHKKFLKANAAKRNEKKETRNKKN